MNHKSKIIKIIHKKTLTEEDKEDLVSIMSILSKKELKSLIGKNAKQYDQGVKRLMLNNYLKIDVELNNLKQKISIEINTLIKKADGIKDQKEKLLLKSREILEKHLERAKNNEFNIPKNANFKVIAATIVFTGLVSNNNMPKINIAKLSGIAYSLISRYYTRYFKELYPKKNFSRITSLYGFSKIKNIISLYFFNLIKNGNIETHEMVLDLKRNFKPALIKQLSRREMTLLNDLYIKKEDIFTQYFSELVVVVKELVISSLMHKKINARFTVKYLAEYLYNKEISLLQVIYNLIDNE